jgi:transposase
MKLELIGIDLAKNVFHLHGVDGLGRELFRKRVYRGDLLSTLRG